MRVSEILIRQVATDQAGVYDLLAVASSSAGAPWRDLARLERGRKSLPGVEVTLLWPTVAVAHGGACLERRLDGGALRAVEVSAGDVFVYPQGACLYVRTQTPLETTAVQLAPAVLLAVAEDLGAPASMKGGDAAPDAKIEAIAALLEAEARAGCPAGRLYAEHLAYALAAHLVQRYGAPGGARQASPRLGGSRLAAVLEYIHAHPGRNLSLQDLAQAAHLSPFHFSRLFKSSTGMTPHQYVLQWRVEEAKRLLRHSRVDLAEIAARLGFGDQSHFTARFRRLTGETPKRWRESA